MNIEENYLLMTFDSTSHSIYTEKKAKEADLTVVLLPTPTEITQSCGFALKFLNSESEKLFLFRKSLDFTTYLYDVTVANTTKEFHQIS